MANNKKQLLVKEVIKSSIAVSSEDGHVVFNRIKQILDDKQKIVIDFQDIEMLTTAFLNAAIGQLYSEYTSELLNESIHFANVDEDDKILFKKVVLRAREYFEHKKEFENSANSAFYGCQ